MAGILSDKAGKVVVVDPSGPVRQLLTEGLRNAGFENVQGLGSPADVVELLEVEEVDWVLTPLMADQPVNGLHLLRLASEYPILKQLRVTLFLEEAEQKHLPSAFELGLLSWIPKPITKDSLAESLTKLTEVHARYGEQEALTAGSYLREYFQTNQKTEQAAALSKSLLEQFPGNGRVLLDYGRDQHAAGHKEVAKQALHQVSFIDEKLKDEAEGALHEFFGDSTEVSESESATPFNALGLNTVLIIDSDEAVRRAIAETLTSTGVPQIHQFTDGEEAWAWIDGNDEPDLIVTEWRIPKVTAPMLIQRMRQKKYFDASIVVVSSLLKAQDMPLLKEVGVAAILNKPVNRDAFLTSLIALIQQDRNPTEHRALESKIRKLLQAGKSEEAEEFRSQYLAADAIPIGKKRFIEAEFAYYNNDFAAACSNGIEALKLIGDNVLLLNILGKSFMQTRNFDAALKAFNKAQSLSPHNIERLCSLAEVQTELGDNEAAKKTLGDATEIDPDSKAVEQAKVKCAIASGDTNLAKELMGNMESLSDIIAYQNNKAVAAARCEQVEEAIKNYRDTIRSVPEDRQDIKAIVLYNLALAYVRSDSYEEAVIALDKTMAIKQSRVSAKAKSLKTRVQKALDEGQPIVLRSSSKTPTAKSGGDEQPAAADAAAVANELASEDDYKRLLAAVQAKRGDIALFLIFAQKDQQDPESSALLAKGPNFKRRKAIERDESFGAEKAKKAS